MYKCRVFRDSKVNGGVYRDWIASRNTQDNQTWHDMIAMVMRLLQKKITTVHRQFRALLNTE